MIKTVLKYLMIELLVLKNYLISNKEAKLIGVVIYAGIGDNLLAAPLIKYLKNKNPMSKLVLVTKRNACQVHANNELINMLITFEDNQKDKITELLMQCDIIYSLRSPLWLIWYFFCNYNGRLYFNPTYERIRIYSRIRSKLSTEYKRRFYSTRHIQKTFIPDSDFSSVHKANTGLEKSVEQNIDFPINITLPYLILHTGGADHIRKLTNNCIKEILEEFEIQIVLVGDNTEQKYSDHTNCIDLRGKTSLSELMKLIKYSACVIAPDSMVMHMTSFTDTPLVALMGNALQDTYGPTRIDENTIILNRFPDCAPCSKTSCTKYNGLSCEQSIDSIDIINSVKKIIK